MSGKGRKPTSDDRSVTAEEAELWGLATQRDKPLKAKPRVADKAPLPSAEGPPMRPALRASDKADAPKPRKPPPAPPPSAPIKSPPPLADLDRRTVRQIAAGKTKMDDRIDLHGMRQADARASLRAFLFDAYARGLKTVLVITGKGAEQDRGDHLGRALGEPERGVLRRNVPQWLAQPEFRSVVLGFTGANARHGGDGALYVQLRKSRKD
jgi:DNA-nicking Smr family endonuclease